MKVEPRGLQQSLALRQQLADVSLPAIDTLSLVELRALVKQLVVAHRALAAQVASLPRR